MHSSMITRRKGTQLNAISSNTCLVQPMASAHTHIKVAVAGPVFMTINERQKIKLDGHKEVIQMRPISKPVTLAMHSRQQLEQPTFIIHFYTMPYGRGVHLFANFTTNKSATTAQVTSPFGPPSNSDGTTLSETVRHFSSFMLVGIWPKRPTSKLVERSFRYSNTEISAGVTAGALRSQR